jgi:hypothetical protein
MQVLSRGQVLDAMPEICRFHGLVIFMYFNDHEPAHFHVRGGATRARVRVDPVSVLSGNLRGRALALVLEWATVHQHELLDNWDRLRTERPVRRIEPLE